VEECREGAGLDDAFDLSDSVFDTTASPSPVARLGDSRAAQAPPDPDASPSCPCSAGLAHMLSCTATSAGRGGGKSSVPLGGREEAQKRAGGCTAARRLDPRHAARGEAHVGDEAWERLLQDADEAPSDGTAALALPLHHAPDHARAEQHSAGGGGRKRPRQPLSSQHASTDGTIPAAAAPAAAAPPSERRRAGDGHLSLECVADLGDPELQLAACSPDGEDHSHDASTGGGAGRGGAGCCMPDQALADASLQPERRETRRPAVAHEQSASKSGAALVLEHVDPGPGVGAAAAHAAQDIEGDGEQPRQAGGAGADDGPTGRHGAAAARHAGGAEQQGLQGMSAREWLSSWDIPASVCDKYSEAGVEELYDWQVCLLCAAASKTSESSSL